MRKYALATALFTALLACYSQGQNQPIVPPSNTQGVIMGLQVSTRSEKILDLFANEASAREFQSQFLAELKPQIKEMLHCDESGLELRFDLARRQGLSDFMNLVINLHPQALPVASEFGNAAVDQLTKTLQGIETADKTEMLQKQKAAAEERLRKYKADKGDADQKLQALQNQRRDRPQFGDGPAARYKINEQKQGIVIEIAAKSARMEAIESTLKRLADEGQQSVKTDPIATEMQKLVDVLEKKLAEETERYKAGLSPNGHTDVLAADAALSEAKIRLLERQEAVAHSVGGDKVNELRGQVITLQADLAESQGRLKITSQLADEAARSHALDDELQDEKQKIGDLESKIGQVSIEIENLGKELKEVEPTTIVLAQSETVVSKDDKSPASQP